MSNLSSGEGRGIHVETIGNQAYDNVTSILFRSPYIHLDDYHEGAVAVDLILPTRGISYYACMDEPLEVVPKESGALFFDDELTHGGAYLEVDRIHKAYGIQFKSDKKDGCYLQSNSRLNPLVETIVNYKELTK